MKNKSIEIKLLGQKIALRTTSESSDSTPNAVAIESVAQLVNQKIQEVESRSKSGVPQHIALLALCDLAAEHLRSQARVNEFQNRIDGQTREILKWVESELSP